jgi:hypothetical protein
MSLLVVLLPCLDSGFDDQYREIDEAIRTPEGLPAQWE